MPEIDVLKQKIEFVEKTQKTGGYMITVYNVSDTSWTAISIAG